MNFNRDVNLPLFEFVIQKVFIVRMHCDTWRKDFVVFYILIVTGIIILKSANMHEYKILHEYEWLYNILHHLQN